ncbi:2OG-Fe dioxygenase family protein [Lysobacter korlensis]|uniref:2OG-Fe dioxygenase family protein n=1 Tax=Lysobacter korlensis TaxID=553636 RepID=A0ABV6RS92_9GAMM
MKPRSEQSQQPEALGQLQRDGFAFLRGGELRTQLLASGDLSDWAAFAESWNRLAIDPYLAATGRRRLRRHGVFRLHPSGVLEQQPAQAHFQTVENNILQGGIERWFEPLEPRVAASRALEALVKFGGDAFDALDDGATPREWRVEVHQFRIEAHLDQAGEPTPEGAHRDGVDWVFVALIDRVNISSGTTTVHRPDGLLLGSFTLERPLDAALVNDRRILHGVTPVKAFDPSLPAYRDVMVVTYTALDR